MKQNYRGIELQQYGGLVLARLCEPSKPDVLVHPERKLNQLTFILVHYRGATQI
jgi:hypothetical protein